MLQARTIPVQVKDAAYEVAVQPGSLAEAGKALRRLSNSKKCAVISDDQVEPLHSPALLKSLKSEGFDVVAVTLPSGEENKTVESANLAYDKLLSAGIERSTPIIAL